MNYLLNDDQTAFVDTARKFLAEHAEPLFLHRIADRHGDWRRDLGDLWQAFAELGFASLLIAEEDGGTGLSLFDAVLINEVIGASAAPLPFIGHQLCCLAIAQAGNAEQKARWLPLLASGELVGSVALQGRLGSYRPDSWQAQAGGEKNLTLANVEVSGSHFPTLIVTGLAGGGLGVVDPQAPSLLRLDKPCVDPIGFLADFQVNEGNIEALANGSTCSQALVDAGLALQAAQACGGIAKCVELATEYTKVREQFGVPIGQFQAVKHQLAEIALEGEPNRPLVWHAAQCVATGESGASRHAALAKAHLADAYLHVARKTIELHGGFGYTWEADLHLYLKRAMFLSAHLGSALSLRQYLADNR
ncbi:acyl-CoA/acyl-ACP dehydrogenase [Pseudomonas sp. GD03860]|uniref:acyl-CoA dehydrogenase family protein n=1 Tax=Pseudomonas TaxID=286 RepID=UPI0023631A0D|nr:MULTISPECIES: acyl-CoA dehydrogenase family protein [Pseudomonas]MDD2058361.1 acyl-CoA/acyl-ACP dehydrogenase [Pseudomonas putida]MDH0636291.1 acyl-CoA/acyl-ACP dehydrogenase [Pseudomonas sp. GD03860]